MIAELGGRTYLMPRQQQQQQPRMAPAPRGSAPDENAPWDIPMGADLANVENLTNNYYNAYGTLKDFTTTMWKDYGIDVTKPDFAQPGGGSLHQAFQAMDAELRMAADDLSAHKKSTDEMNKLKAQGKLVEGVSPTMGAYDPNKMLARQFDVSPYVSTELNDTTLKAIDKAQQTYYTTGDVNAANAVLQPIKDEYTRLIGADPYNAEYYQRQLNAIMDASKSTPSVALKPPGTGPSKYTDLFKEVVSTARGAWPEGTYKAGEVDGKAVAIKEPPPGFKMGKAQVLNQKGGYDDVDKNVKIFYRTQDGNVYAKFYDDRLPDQQLNTLTASEILVSAKDHIGGQKAIDYLTNEVGKGDLGNVTDEGIGFTPTVMQAASAATLETAKGAQQKLDVLKNEIRTELDKLSYWSSIWQDTEIDGIKVEKNWNTYSIDKDSFTKLTGEKQISKQKYPSYKSDGMTREELISFLSEVGYFQNKLQEAGNKPAAQTAPSTSKQPITPYTGPGANFLN